MTERTIPHITARLMLNGMGSLAAGRHAAMLDQAVRPSPNPYYTGAPHLLAEEIERREFEDRREFYMRECVAHFPSLGLRLLSTVAHGYITFSECEKRTDVLVEAGHRRRITPRPMRQLFLMMAKVKGLPEPVAMKIEVAA